MQSRIITGSDLKSRTKTARALVSEQSGKFDTIIIDTAEVRGIEAVKEVIRAISKKPYESKLTSVLIIEAQYLTIEAQNALLKSLEEPPTFSQIILTANSKDSLLPTVASRLEEISLNAEPKTTEIILNLQELAGKKLSERLVQIEKMKREDYAQLWAIFLKDAATSGDKNLKTVHRYNKLLLRLLRAEKALVNKKLIDLILALEIPN